ncbi:hypothetical protein N2152v2_002991 [Parachlorella kessleri]
MESGEPQRAVSSSPAGAPPKPSGWATFWGAVDKGAWLGAIGTAAAFIITQEAILASAPVALPLLALYASKQRERLVTEAFEAELVWRSRQLMEHMGQLARGAAGEAAATEIARAVELQQQAGAASASALRTLEAKLAAVEGSVLSTGSGTREALKESAASQGQLAKDTIARLEALATTVRRDISSDVRQAGAEELAALSRLDARLASLEGAIRSLEASQGEGLRRVYSGVASTLQESEGRLEASVRWEAERALEPLRRLPQLLSQAMPVTPEVLGPAPTGPLLSEESLRQVLAEQLSAASQQILQQQAALLQELRGQPQLVAPQQWNQLGSRLLSLQEEVRLLLTAQHATQQAQQDAALAAQQAQQAPAAAGIAELAGQLEALRADVAALGSSLQTLAGRASAAVSGSASTADKAGEAGTAEEPAAVGLEDEVDAGLVGRLNAAALAAWQQEQQKAQLGQVVVLLQGLAGRLDGLGQQVTAALAQQQQRELLPEAGQPETPGPPTEGAAGAESEGSEQQQDSSEAAGREEAYRRMQALLSSRGGDVAAQRSNGSSSSLAAEEQPRQGAVPFREWLSGDGVRQSAVPSGSSSLSSSSIGASQGAQGEPPAVPAAENGAQVPEPSSTAAAVGNGHDGAGTGAGPAPAVGASEAAARSRNGAVSNSSSSSSSSGGAGQPPFLQSTIAYGAALGLFTPEEAEAGSTAAEESAAGIGAADSAAQPAVAATGQAGAASAAPEAPDADGQAGVGGWQQQQEALGQGVEPHLPSRSAPRQQQQQLASRQQQEQPVSAGTAAEPGASPWLGAVSAAGTQGQPPQNPASDADASVGSTEPTPEPAAAPAAAGPLAAAADSPMNAEASGTDASPGGWEGPSPEALYERGRRRLQEGRELAATPGGDLGLADSLLCDAEECFSQVLQQQPDNLRALGNLGNAFMAHGRLRMRMLPAAAPAAAGNDPSGSTNGSTGGRASTGIASSGTGGSDAGARDQLERQALELFLMAGRHYKRVVQLDGSQLRAIVNWGRVICLRAEIDKQAGRLQEAADLFSLAADKFDAALDVDPQSGQAMRLAGMALLDMAACISETDRRQAKQLLKDAKSYLVGALVVNPLDAESGQKLEECQRWLAYLKSLATSSSSSNA